MSCSRIAVALTACILVVACGGEQNGVAPATSDAVATTNTVAERTTPTDATPTTSRLPIGDEPDLLILGSTRDAVEAAIEPYGGEVVLANDGGVFQVRFPVDSLDELRDIEADLEAQGFNVQLNYADDEPAPSGDS